MPTAPGAPLTGWAAPLVPQGQDPGPVSVRPLVPPPQSKSQQRLAPQESLASDQTKPAFAEPAEPGKTTLSKLLAASKPGDLVFIEKPDRCCPIADRLWCAAPERFARVGLVFHGASVVPARLNGGDGLALIEIEAPHLLDSGDGPAGPLEQRLRAALGQGTRVFWRAVSRPALRGEPVGRDGVMPKIVPRRVRALGGSSRFDMPGGFDWEAPHAEVLTAGCHESARLPLTANVFGPRSDEASVAIGKLRDWVSTTHTGVPCKQLREPLSFREWSQACVGQLSQSGLRGGLLGPCADCLDCLDKQKEREITGPGLLAHQMLRAGWRNGAVPSERFKPADFAEGSDQLLRADLAQGVEFGPMVRVYLNQSEIMQELGGCPSDLEPEEELPPTEETPLFQRVTASQRRSSTRARDYSN